MWLSQDRQAPIADPARLSAARLLGTELTLVGGATLGGWASVELPTPPAPPLGYLDAAPPPLFAPWTHPSPPHANPAPVPFPPPPDRPTASKPPPVLRL